MDVKSSFLCVDLQEKNTWNNLLAMIRINLALFSTLRNLFMVLSKLLELGMPKWVAFFLTSTFLDVILTQIYMPRK